MTSRNNADDRQWSRDVVCRRKVLSAVGAGTLAGVAGCSGDGGGGDGGGDGGSGDGGEGGDPVATLCADLTAEEYAAYDVGETQLIANFDAPSPLVDEFEPYVPGTHRALIDVDRNQLRVDVGYRLSGEDLIDGEPIERENDPVLSEIEFNGETVPVYGQREQVKVNRERGVLCSANLNLPYAVNGTELYFPANVLVELDTLEPIPEDCRERVEPTAVAIAESLRLNEANTAEQWINDNWENPP